MTNTIYLICGVPGSGKTWVCKQLTEKFEYIPHDDHVSGFRDAINLRAPLANRPLISECPFGERRIKEALEGDGFHVVPIFIVENPLVIAQRYSAREGKAFPKAHETRAVSIKDRAIEWGAFHGTSGEVLEMLSKLN